jgi:hypothetical protein
MVCYYEKQSDQISVPIPHRQSQDPIVTALAERVAPPLLYELTVAQTLIFIGILLESVELK